MIAHLLNVDAEIQNPTVSQDPHGSVIETWTKTATARCRIRQLTAREMVVLGRDGINSTHRVYFDYRSDITPKSRLVILGSAYDVITPNDPHGLHKHLEVDARLRK